MKVDEFKSEVWGYYSEYSHNGGFGDFIESYDTDDMTFDELVEHCCYEYNVEGKMIRPGLWVGTGLGDTEISEEADEDGKYLYTNVYGALCVVSDTRLMDEDQKFLDEADEMLDKFCDDLQSEAEEKIEEDLEGWRDEALYAKDPYAYYGLRRSDFF